MDSLIIGIAQEVPVLANLPLQTGSKSILEMMLWCFTMTISTADKMEFPLKRE